MALTIVPKFGVIGSFAPQKTEEEKSATVRSPYAEKNRRLRSAGTFLRTYNRRGTKYNNPTKRGELLDPLNEKIIKIAYKSERTSAGT